MSRMVLVAHRHRLVPEMVDWCAKRRREQREWAAAALVWTAIMAVPGTIIVIALLGTIAALLGGCGSSPPQVIERVVTVPVHEHCVPPAPILKSVPEPTCTPKLNPDTCKWPSPQDAATFIDNTERLVEWVAITVRQCAQTMPGAPGIDAGP